MFLFQMILHLAIGIGLSLLTGMMRGSVLSVAAAVLIMAAVPPLPIFIAMWVVIGFGMKAFAIYLVGALVWAIYLSAMSRAGA
jgi:hypothetical protein